MSVDVNRWLPVETPACVECRRAPREDENPLDDWRCYSDGVGELHAFCPECATREFGARE